MVRARVPFSLVIDAGNGSQLREGILYETGRISALMLDVDLRNFWAHGFGVFTAWFVPSGLLMKHAVLRVSTRGRPLLGRVGAEMAMAAASWLFVVALPLAILAEALVQIYILDRI